MYNWIVAGSIASSDIRPNDNHQLHLNQHVVKLKGCMEEDPKRHLTDCKIFPANCFSLIEKRRIFDIRSRVT